MLWEGTQAPGFKWSFYDMSHVHLHQSWVPFTGQCCQPLCQSHPIRLLQSCKVGIIVHHFLMKETEAEKGEETCQRLAGAKPGFEWGLTVRLQSSCLFFTLSSLLITTISISTGDCSRKARREVDMAHCCSTENLSSASAGSPQPHPPWATSCSCPSPV